MQPLVVRLEVRLEIYKESYLKKAWISLSKQIDNSRRKKGPITQMSTQEVFPTFFVTLWCNQLA